MMPSVADVEATTGLLLDLLDSADYCVRESGWGVKVFEDLSAAYRTDPGPIDAVFRKAQELGCFPCSADNWQLEDVRVRDVERAELAEKAFALMEWGPCRSILPQILDDAVSSLHTMSWEMIERFNRYEPPGFDMLFLDLLRKQPNPKCAGHRYLANDSIRHCVFAFKTAHEVAAWWIWHVGRYHDYSWNGPRSNDWREWNVPEFIAQTRDNFEDAATRLITILNLEYLKDLINDESLAMAAAIDGRSWPRRGTETINEWMTPPLVGMLTTAPLKLIDEGEYSWTVMDMSNNQEGVYPTGPSIDDVQRNPAHEGTELVQVVADGIRVSGDDGSGSHSAAHLGLILDSKHKSVSRAGAKYERYDPETFSEDAWTLIVELDKSEGKLTTQQLVNLLPHHNRNRRNNAAKELKRKLEFFDATCRFDRGIGQWVLVEETAATTAAQAR